MRRLESIEDDRRGVVTYELANGKRVTLDRRVVAERGVGSILNEMCLVDLVPNERIAVVQGGRHIGTVPPDFDPLFIKSKTFLYDPRPGDFRREGDKWVADTALGHGDLDAVPGFVRTS